jgi:hypothetical protein
MNFIKRKVVNSFDRLLTRVLIKRFDLLDNQQSQKSECPELDILAAYLDHNLTEAQTRELEGHMVECRLCRKMVINTFKSLENLPDLPCQK